MRTLLVLLALAYASAWLNKQTAPANVAKKIMKAIPQALLVGTLATSSIELAAPQPAVADFRAAQKRTYFRQSPKLIEGGAFLTKDLKNAVETEDYKVIGGMFDDYASKVIASRDNEVVQTDTFVNAKFYRPMTVLAGSFAERGTSEKQRQLMDQEQAFEQAFRLLEGTTKDLKDGDFFFSPTIKMPTGAARKKQAQEGLKSATEAYNKFVTITNKGLMMELNKLPLAGEPQISK